MASSCTGFRLNLPQSGCSDRLEIDSFAERATQEIGDAAHQHVEIERLGAERLATRKSEQPLRERGAALGASHRLRQGDPHPVLRGLGPILKLAPRQLEISYHDSEQVVEVVRDAAGELADGLHLLRLAQRVLGNVALARRLTRLLHGCLLEPRAPQCQERQRHEPKRRRNAEVEVRQQTLAPFGDDRL